MRYLLLMVLVSILVVPAFATTTTLNPVADSPLLSNAGSINYGSQSYGYWGSYNTYKHRTLVSYDLTGLAGEVVTAAEITFTLNYNLDAGEAALQARKLEASWEEMVATWNNQPTHDTTGAGLMLDQAWVSGLGPHTLSLTAEALPIIQDWIDNSSNNFGLVLIKDPEGTNNRRCYPQMKEYSGNDGVQLTLEHIMPVPTAFNLLTPTTGTVIPVIDKGTSSSENETVIKAQPIASGKAVENVDFTWESSTTAGAGNITYNWECDDDPAFGSPDYTATGLATEAHTEAFTVTADETWYWRVTAAEDAHSTETVCTADFNFEFDWSSNIESSSLGGIKAEFK